MTFTILCAGNHSKDIQEIAARSGAFWVNVYDDNPDTGYDAPPKDLSDPFVVGINDPQIRRRIVEQYAHLRGASPLIDPSALLGSNVVLGLGVVVAANASLVHSVTLGDHVHVNYHASMTRCTVGQYTTISPAATICGNVDIGEGCIIGAGSVVAERCTIGDNVTIGAGAVIPPYSYVNDNAVVVGVFRGSR